MQYANIIVNHKAGYEPFTYSLPPELLGHLAVGSVVMVPVGKSQVHGVIDQFVRHSEPKVVNKLKPIKSIVYEGSFVAPYLLTAAQALHEQYGWGVQEILFKLLPDFPKRSQTYIASSSIVTSTFHSQEYCLSVSERPQLYRRLAQSLLSHGTSLLVVCASQSAAQALAAILTDLPITLYPETVTPKSQRDYYLQAATATGRIFIGTRGALITPLHHVGAVIIDEPWLPGQKEERAPRLWSGQLALALCQARGIPLYLLSSLPWPESRSLTHKSPKLIKSTYGSVHLTPRRSLSENLVEFLADHDGAKKQLAIFIKPSTQTVYWCKQCKQSTVIHGLCAICGREPIVLPILSKDTITAELSHLPHEANVHVFASEELIQFQHFDAALVLNFDVYLAVVDFRATTYLVTLLYLIGAQAKTTVFVTNHHDEWTHLTHKDVHYFLGDELTQRKMRQLPPFGKAIELTAASEDVLKSLDAPSKPGVLQTSPIRHHKHEYRIALLSSLSFKLPEAWFKKSNLKIDILPNYIDSA